MKSIKILDLFSDAGGGAYGYCNAFISAGFNVHITGVDIKPQPHYPFHFIQADAMTYSLDGFDFVHASPPCQEHTKASAYAKSKGATYSTGWMLDATYERFQSLSVPWIIENVAGATMYQPVLLCGSMFGLGVLRHRLFDSNIILFAPPVHQHQGSVQDGSYITAVGQSYHGRHGESRHTFKDRCTAMGIDWMLNRELIQAIPPAYTAYLGQQLVPLFIKNTRRQEQKPPTRTRAKERWIAPECWRSTAKARSCGATW